MNDKIEQTLDKLRIEAFERGIPFEEFSVLLLGAVTMLLHRQTLSARMAKETELEATL